MWRVNLSANTAGSHKLQKKGFRIQGILTMYIDRESMIDWISNPIVSCTAVLSSKISFYVYNTPGTSIKQHLTICAIQQHSGPGDIWGWFTSCMTVHIQIRTLRNSLSIWGWS